MSQNHKNSTTPHFLYNEKSHQCHVREDKKGSFSAKFRDPDSKSAAYFIENIGWVEKTTNSAFNIAGLDYKTNFSSKKPIVGMLHAMVGVADFVKSEDKSPMPILNTLMYNLNLHTNLLSGHHPTMQCLMETSFSFVKNAGFSNLPNAILFSNMMTGLICLNRELNSGPYRDSIHLTLDVIKTSLYFLSPLKTLQAISLIKNAWLLDELLGSSDNDMQVNTISIEKQELTGTLLQDEL